MRTRCCAAAASSMGKELAIARYYCDSFQVLVHWRCIPPCGLVFTFAAFTRLTVCAQCSLLALWRQYWLGRFLLVILLFSDTVYVAFDSFSPLTCV
eukprot:1907725-Amphidinium_carterae.1